MLIKSEQNYKFLAKNAQRLLCQERFAKMLRIDQPRPSTNFEEPQRKRDLKIKDKTSIKQEKHDRTSETTSYSRNHELSKDLDK